MRKKPRPSDNLWYVTDMLAFPDVHIFSKAFFTEEDAYKAIDLGLGGNHKRFDVIRGSEANKLNLVHWHGNYKVIKPRDYITKYAYGTPPPMTARMESGRRDRWWKRDARRNIRYAKRRAILLELRQKQQ